MQRTTGGGIDFRAQPEKYLIGRGEQGVLIAEPYKSEILLFWKFKTVAAAKQSAGKIYELFEDYGKAADFVGMDMARKFLQMGFTRARRYANHPSGRKYDAVSRERLAQAGDWQDSEKARAAAIFYEKYQRAKTDPLYLQLKQAHQRRQA